MPENYTWHIGNIKDNRIVIRYLGKEIGRATSPNKALRIEQKHIELTVRNNYDN